MSSARHTASHARNTTSLPSAPDTRSGGPDVTTDSDSPASVTSTGDAATRESLEDYTLRFAPRSYRRWTPFVVGGSALGGMAYMADFSIGAGIGLQYGTGNALWAIAVAAVIIFVS